MATEWILVRKDASIDEILREYIGYGHGTEEAARRVEESLSFRSHRVIKVTVTVEEVS